MRMFAFLRHVTYQTSVGSAKHHHSLGHPLWGEQSWLLFNIIVKDGRRWPCQTYRMTDKTYTSSRCPEHIMCISKVTLAKLILGPVLDNCHSVDFPRY